MTSRYYAKANSTNWTMTSASIEMRTLESNRLGIA